MSNSSAHLSRNLNWVVSTNVLVGVANFVVVAWFARMLGPGTLGNYAALLTTVQLIAAVLSAGFDQAVIRMPNERNLAAAAALATLGQSLLMIAGSAITYGYVAFNFPGVAEEVVGPGCVVLCTIVFSLFTNLLAAPLAARLEYRVLAAGRLLAVSLGILAGIGVVQMGGGLYGLVLRDAVAAAALLIFCRLRSGPVFGGRGTLAAFRRLFVFSRGLWALNVTERLVLRLDYGAVGCLLGSDALGAYFVVRGLVEGLLGYLIQPIQTVLFAHLCATDRNSGRSVIRPARAALILLMGSVCLAMLAALAGEWAVVGLVGPGYAAASIILPGLAIYSGAAIWYELQKIESMARLDHSRMVAARGVQLVVFGLLVIPTTERFGLAGVSIATAAGALGLAVFASWLAYGPFARAKVTDSGTP